MCSYIKQCDLEYVDDFVFTRADQNELQSFLVSSAVVLICLGCDLQFQKVKWYCMNGLGQSRGLFLQRRFG